MILLLGFSLLGSLLVRRGLAEGPWVSCLVGPPLAFWLFLVLTNTSMLLSGKIGPSSLVAVAAMVLLAAFLHLRNREVADLPGGDRCLCLWGLFLGLLTYLFTNSMRYNGADYDYWLDFAQQGLFLRDQFPPSNPFFVDMPMHGHYGRSLLVAALAWLSSSHLASVQHYAVALAHAWSLPLLILGLRRLGATPAQCVLAALWALFGVCAGGWAGLLDHSYHHSAIAQLGLFLVVFLGARLLDKDRPAGPGAGVFLAIAMAGLGLVFEIYLLLALIPLMILAFKRPHKHLLVALAVGLLLSLTQGGVLTDATIGKLMRPAQSQNEALHNQMQRVHLRFPKQRLGQIYLQQWSYWRYSYAHSFYPKLYGELAPVPAPQYARIWGWNVIRMHWLPLFLAPLVGLRFWFTRCRAAFLWWTFATISYCVPALVDFGPIYEGEYYRWEFAAGLGYAIALGVTLGGFLSGSGSRRGRALTWLLVAAWTALGCYPGLAPLWQRLRVLEPRYWTTWFTPPLADGWLVRNLQAISSTEADLEMAHWLAAHSEPSHTVLANICHETPNNPFALTSESTLIGLTGLKFIGHTTPISLDFIGTPPFRRNRQAQSWWATPTWESLKQLRVNWVWVDPQRQGEAWMGRLLQLKGLTESYRTSDQAGHQRILYQVQVDEPFPQLNWNAGGPDLHIELPRGKSAGLPIHLQGYLEPVSSSILVARFIDARGAVDEPTFHPIKDGKTVDCWVGTPHEPGQYKIQVGLLEANGRVLQCEPQVQVGFLNNYYFQLP